MCINQQTNEALQLLRLNGNKLETKEQKGGMYFAQALQINTTLLHLDLGDTDMVTLLSLPHFSLGLSQQLTDTSRSTKSSNAILKCCYAPHSDEGTIFNHMLLA